jgi:hypothetical protein
MASEVGIRVAEVILEDREGEGVWKNAESLALYLVGSYVPGTLLHEEAQTVAEAILADIDGALADVQKLAEFVDAEMAKIRDQA